MDPCWNRLRTDAYVCARRRRMQPADADDLAQETCLRYLRQRAKAATFAMVRTVAEGLRKDWLRRCRREAELAALLSRHLSREFQRDKSRDRYQSLQHMRFLRRCRRAGLSVRQVLVLSWVLNALGKQGANQGLTWVARQLGWSTPNLRRFMGGVAVRLRILAEDDLDSFGRRSGTDRSDSTDRVKDG